MKINVKNVYRREYVQRIVSGGQTGVDRAALDAAIELGMAHGGWCPRGRKAEDGTIDLKYQLKETPSKDYAQRTEWNVRDSNGTLIITWGKATGGTALTINFAIKHKKPCLILDFNKESSSLEAVDWISKFSIKTLNVAGPRASFGNFVYISARKFLMSVFSCSRESTPQHHV